MFQSTVLPHAFLLFYFHVSLCQLLLKLPDVQQCELLELIRAPSNPHLYPTTAIQHRPLIHLYNHHTPPVLTQSVTAELLTGEFCFVSSLNVNIKFSYIMPDAEKQTLRLTETT